MISLAKKLWIFSLFFIIFDYVWASNSIATVPEGYEVLSCGMLESNIPIAILCKEAKGLVSTVREFYVLYGDEKLGPYDDIHTLFFIKNASTFAYKAKVEDKWYMFIGKKKVSGPFLRIDFITTSKNCNRFSYTGWGIDGRYIYTEEGLVGGPYWATYKPVFSADGSSFAYVVAIKDDLEYIMHDGETIAPFKHVSKIDFVTDDQIFAYSATVRNESYIVVGKEKIGPFDNASDFAFSSDGKRLAYSANKGYKTYIFCDKLKVGPFDYWVKDLIFPYNSADFIYIGAGSKYQIGKGKEKITKCDWAHNLISSTDGKNMAYFAQIKNKMYVMLNKEKIGAFENADLNDVENMKFHADNSSLAFSVRMNNKWYNKLYFDGNVYTGTLCGEKIIYLKDNQIMLKE